MQFDALDLVRLPDQRDQAVIDDLQDFVGVGDAVQNDDELVAAEAADRVANAHRREQAARHRA